MKLYDNTRNKVICCQKKYMNQGTHKHSDTQISPSMTPQCDHEDTDTLSNLDSRSFLALPQLLLSHPPANAFSPSRLPPALQLLRPRHVVELPHFGERHVIFLLPLL